MKRQNSHLTGFSSGTELGGTVSRYRDKQNIYHQGAPAASVFYIQQGGVQLTTRTKNQRSVTAILGVGDFFGELCLVGYPLRMSTAVALTASSIRTVEKTKMLQMLRNGNSKISNSLVAYLLSSVQKHKEHVSELLTSSGEQRLARVLLRLAHLDKGGPAVVEIPRLSHQVLAEMIGTTRPRVNLFMNRFRKQGFIAYDGGLDRGLEVHRSLRKVLRSR